MPDIDYVRKQIERHRFEVSGQSKRVLHKGTVPGGRRW